MGNGGYKDYEKTQLVISNVLPNSKIIIKAEASLIALKMT